MTSFAEDIFFILVCVFLMLAIGSYIKKILKKPAEQKLFILNGSIKGFLVTIPGSILFVLIFATMFRAKNEKIEPDMMPVFVLGFFTIGLILSFVPACVGGSLLADWLYQTKTLSVKSGMVKGATAAGLSMLGFDLIIGLLNVSMPHNLPVNMFLFYTITSFFIAIIAGALVGVQLTKNLIKSEKENQLL